MMTTQAMNLTDFSDAELVVQSLAGDRDAFGQIVARHQALLCSLAYSTTGSLSQSEDLAQETFVTAWRQLASLREPEKLRSWLCRILRNLSYDAVGKDGREPSHQAESLEEIAESHSPEPMPPDQVISAEEMAILWRSLERIPEIYREPLVLFYREHQSIETVAHDLELSEDAVKQRLSRGRKLLQEQFLAFVAGALKQTTPDKTFTLAVMAALPLLATTAQAATATAATTKGGALAKASATTAFSSALMGAFLICFGNYVGYRMSLESAQSERERQFIKSFYGRLLAGVLGFGVVAALVMWFGWPLAQTHPSLLFALFSSLCGLYALVMVGSSFWWLRKRHESFGESQPDPAAVRPAWEYRSRAEWLGWPLVHWRVGGGLSGSRHPVKAWFAMGDYAIGGVFAFGRLAIAPVSIGFLAVGLLPFGCLAVGVFPIGGISLGVWVFGGLAIGWQACGGCAVAWNAAWGGVAIAHDFAAGSLASAAQANSLAADQYVAAQPALQAAQVVLRHIGWMQLLWVLPLLFSWRQLRRAVKSPSATM